MVADAAALMNEIIGWLGKGEGRKTEEGKQERNALEVRVMTLAAKFNMAGMSNESDEVSNYWSLADESDARLLDDRKKIARTYNQTMADLAKSIDS